MKTTDNITLYSIPAVFSSCMSGHRTWGPLASADALFVAWYLGMPFPRCHPTGRAYRCCQRCSVETPVLRTASTECPQMTSTPCKSPSSVKWFQMYNVVNAIQNCCDMALPLHGRALRPWWARTISLKYRNLKQTQRPVYPATLLPEWSNDWLLMPLQRTEILKVKAPRHRMQL